MKYSILGMSMMAASAFAAALPASLAPRQLEAAQQAALDAHNAARAEVGTPALVWDDTLAASAADWAAHLVSIGGLEHSGAGENLYMSWGAGSSDALVSAVGSWNSEKELYNGEILDENNYMIFGHYSKSFFQSVYVLS
jgi:hypothetical protein